MSSSGIDLAAIFQAVLALDRKFDDMSNQIATLCGEVGSLREEVGAYHGSVVGHGILISELDDRVTQLEQGRRSSSS